MNATDKKKCPTATHVVEWKGKDTGKALVGRAALELSETTWGADEWWLLLEPVE